MLVLTGWSYCHHLRRLSYFRLLQRTKERICNLIMMCCKPVHYEFTQQQINRAILRSAPKANLPMWLWKPQHPNGRLEVSEPALPINIVELNFLALADCLQSQVIQRSS